MLKYKDTHVFRYERDRDGHIYNRQDNFILCRSKGKIYRISRDTLMFESPKRIRLKNIDKETGNVLWDYTDLILEVIDTDAERLIKFKEENLEKLESLFKIRKKRQMSEEALEKARARMEEIRKNRIANGDNNELEDDEGIEEDLDDNEDLECEVEEECEMHVEILDKNA